MQFWSRIPFVRILIIFISGILIINQFPESKTILLGFNLLVLIALLTFILLSKSKYLLKNRLSGFGVFILLFVFGQYVGFNSQKSINSELNLDSNQRLWVAKVFSIKPLKSDFCRVISELNREENKLEKGKDIKLLTYIKKDQKKKLKVGDKILFETSIKPIEGPKNPEEFDQRVYYKNKSISLITFIYNYKIIESNTSFNSALYDLNHFLKSKFENSALEDRQYQTLSAIFLGDRTELDYELKESFKNAGAMHVLAVSGLHVGIIYLILVKLFEAFKFFRNKKLAVSAIIISVLWIYAGMTGFSPSVQRAALMFSLFAIGKGLKREPSIYNIISFSAFIMLIINPNFLYDISFQLSFVAVFGIVSIYPILKKLWVFENRWINYFYDILLVSIAAQIATFPLTIYYFHQFPNWFLLTNLFAIPLAFASVGLAAIISVFYLLFQSDLYLSHLLNLCMKLLNSSVGLVDYLPFAIQENIWIEPISMALIYISILLLLVHFYFFKKELVLLSLSLIVVTLFIEIAISILNYEKNYITFYHSNDPILISTKEKQAALVYYKDSLSFYSQRTAQSHLNSLGVVDISYEKIEEYKFGEKIGMYLFQYSDQIVGLNLNQNFQYPFSSSFDIYLKGDSLFRKKPISGEDKINLALVFESLISEGAAVINISHQKDSLEL